MAKRELEKHIEVQRSIIKKYRKTIWSNFIGAVQEYELIKPNDKIAVCISGGKDSVLMACCLRQLQQFSNVPFELVYLVMDPGYNAENRKLIEHNTKLLNLPVHIFESDIFEVTDRVGGSPCYLCARMRRGCLYSKAKELGCNKIALGHHFNDVIETILLNQIYNGQFSGMMPILDSDNFEGMKLIRPLFYVHESDIISWTKFSELTFLDCACIVAKKNIGKRAKIKELVKDLVKMYPNSDINIFNSMFRVNPNTTRNNLE